MAGLLSLRNGIIPEPSGAENSFHSSTADKSPRATSRASLISRRATFNSSNALGSLSAERRIKAVSSTVVELPSKCANNPG